MKIISKENYNSDIESILKKDLLIPCFIYKVPIELSKNRALNFIEETILKLIQIDESLKQDIQRLSKMIGFFSEKKDEDKTKIVKLIVSKLKDLRLEDNAEDKNEVIVYQFYQEAYTNELLPIITQEINDFTFEEKSYKYEDCNEYTVVEFKQYIGSRRNTKAILANEYNKKFYKPTKTDIIKTIFEHNQQKYKESHIIDYKDFKIDTVGNPELIYLHVKLYIPNIKSIVITNGFTNDFSPLLRKIFENQHSELLNVFKNETRVDAQKNQNWDVNIAFENSIDRYGNVKILIQRIEKQSFFLKDSQSGSKDEIKKAKDIFTQSLYDVIEKAFEYLANNLRDTKDLKNQKLLNSLAKDYGFGVDNEGILPIFKVHNNDNLQKYFAKSLFYKKDELYNLAIKYPKILFTLKILFNLRNSLKHSGQREETLSKIQIEKLFEYKEIIYDSISIILKVKQKNIKQKDMINDDSDGHFINAYLDLEKEFGVDVFSQFSQEIKDNLLSINFTLNSIDFKQNQVVIVNEVLTKLYSSIELLLRKKISGLPEKSSLGYIYNIIVDETHLSKNDLELIYRVKELRGHGSLNLEEALEIKEENLKELKNSCFLFIKKLYEEV